MFETFTRLLPWLGDAFGYVLALGELPLSSVRSLLNGMSINWFVTNIFTGELYPIVIPSYNSLLSFLTRNDIPFIAKLGVTVRDVLSTIGDFAYTLVFPRDGHFGIGWDTVPLYVGLPVMLIRVAVLTFGVRLVLKTIGGIVEVAS